MADFEGRSLQCRRGGRDVFAGLDFVLPPSGALAQRQAEVTPDDQEEASHRTVSGHQTISGRGGGARASSDRRWGSSRSRAVWVATTTRPPPARCAAIAAARSCTEAWSRPTEEIGRAHV